VLDHVGVRPDLILVDGYVWSGPDKPGLGARLYESLDQSIPVIGVAKTPFRGDDWSIPVLRGKSRTPLHVTAAGLDPEEAAQHIRDMHGPHRLPEMLKQVDRAARDALAAA
jgi:deoxyribonuclease V